MEHFAEVVSVLTYPGVPENIMPFVAYKASMDKVILEKGLKILVLRVVGTDSYYVIFPEKTTMQRCLDDLKKAGISINKRTELYISKYIR
ncbi:MAG: DUF749 family protein [Thermoplasmata archaeon]|nr:DUF749 family protein [Thermoplasmata archaeon]